MTIHVTQPDLYQPLTRGISSDATLATAIQQLDQIIELYNKKLQRESNCGCQSFLENYAAMGETLIACFELITNLYAAYRQQHLIWFVSASAVCVSLVYRINQLKFEDMQFPEVRTLRRDVNPKLIPELIALAIMAIAAISLARASTEDELNLSFTSNVLSISCSIIADMFEINSPWSSYSYYQYFCALKFVFSTMSCGFIMAIALNLCNPNNDEKLADPGQCFNHIIGESWVEIATLLFTSLSVGSIIFSGYAFSAKVFLPRSTELTWPIDPQYFSYIAPTLTALVTATESAAGGAEGLTDYLHHNNQKDLSNSMILVSIIPLFVFALFAATKKVNALITQAVKKPISLTGIRNETLHSAINRILDNSNIAESNPVLTLYALHELKFILRCINQPDSKIQDMNPCQVIPALTVFPLSCCKRDIFKQCETDFQAPISGT